VITIFILFSLLIFIFLEVDILIIQISLEVLKNLHNTSLCGFGFWEHDMLNVEGFPLFQQTFQFPSSRSIYLGWGGWGGDLCIDSSCIRQFVEGEGNWQACTLPHVRTVHCDQNIPPATTKAINPEVGRQFQDLLKLLKIFGT
jgi:hypothetical protein